MVLISSVKPARNTVQTKEFPSPYGDYGSYQIKPMKSFIKLVSGSFRPLTGIMVLIKKKLLSIALTPCTSFRPLTGIMVLIEVSRKDILKVFRQFPSPYGDYGSYHGTCSGLQHYSCLRFRPLTGIMVLIKSDLQDVCYRLADVSVPLRGLWFLS